MAKIRKRLNPLQVKTLGLLPRDNSENNKYVITKEQYQAVKHLTVTNIKEATTTTETVGYVSEVGLSAVKDGKIMNIDDYCEHHNLPRKDVLSYKLVAHTGTPWFNIAFKEVNVHIEDLTSEYIESTIKKFINPVKVKNRSSKDTEEYTFSRLVLSDIHIGMCTDSNGAAMYATPWNEEELMKRLERVVEDVLYKATGDMLIIDELGDYLDGWDGFTARGGHKLPQNMDNRKAFDVGIRFKVELVDRLVEFFDKIVLNNITRDNHSADFGYVVNSAVKQILETKYAFNVEVNNHNNFINHYYVGNHAFVITHGKDDKHMKFGFKPHLDHKGIEKIDQYLKHNNVYANSSFVEFSKGDSHQMLFDYATSDDFDYFNYPAFSPSSEWVQTNFKKGRSGFVLFNIDYEVNSKQVIPCFF